MAIWPYTQPHGPVPSLMALYPGTQDPVLRVPWDPVLRVPWDPVFKAIGPWTLYLRP